MNHKSFCVDIIPGKENLKLTWICFLVFTDGQYTAVGWPTNTMLFYSISVKSLQKQRLRIVCSFLVLIFTRQSHDRLSLFMSVSVFALKIRISRTIANENGSEPRRLRRLERLIILSWSLSVCWDSKVLRLCWESNESVACSPASAHQPPEVQVVSLSGES